MQVIIRKPCPFRQANELRAPTEYSYLPCGIIIMIPKTYYGARRQQRVKAMYEYTSFYGLLYYSTPTPLHSFFELQITPRTFSCSALKQQEPCRPQQSLTTPFFPCLSLWPYRNIISPFQAHLRSQIRAQDIYLHCWLFRESSIQNNRACFGRCICLMLCRKRDGISI